MNITDLSISQVKFNEREHSYTTPSGQVLSGVTSIIGAVLFPSKYRGIPEEVLRRAAERGTMIHTLCQRTDLFDGLIDDGAPIEVAHYMAMKEAHGITMIANEYLVSDDMQVATMIDCIDSEGNLYDIKTTSKLDEESLSWQLSFCAHLFELQNPALKAGKLYGVWLRPEHREAKLVEVERKKDEEIERVLEAYSSGATLSARAVEDVADSQIAPLVDIETEIIRFKTMITQLEERKQGYLESIKADMQARGLKKVETSKMLVTLVEDSTSQTLDSKRLQADHPDLCAAYLKETKRKGYVKITLRG